MKKFSKTKTKKQIEMFFSNIKNKTPKEIKKVKNLAMTHKISLKDMKKKFCKKCLTSYSGNETIRIKSNIKSITCRNCNSISRWNIQN